MFLVCLHSCLCTLVTRLFWSSLSSFLFLGFLQLRQIHWLGSALHVLSNSVGRSPREVKSHEAITLKLVLENHHFCHTLVAKPVKGLSLHHCEDSIDSCGINSIMDSNRRGEFDDFYQEIYHRKSYIYYNRHKNVSPKCSILVYNLYSLVFNFWYTRKLLKINSNLSQWKI